MRSKEDTLLELIRLTKEHERSRIYIGVEVTRNSGSATVPPAGYVDVKIDGIGTLARYFGEEPSIGDYVEVLIVERSTPVIITNHSSGLSRGWPFDNTVKTDPTNPAADTTTVAGAIALAAAGDNIIFGPATYISNGQTLPDDTAASSVSQDKQDTILQTAANQSCIIIGTNRTNLMSHLTIKNIYTVDTNNIRAITTNSGSLLDLRDCYLYANNASVTNAYAYALYAAGTVYATDCKFEAICGYSNITVGVFATSGSIVYLDAGCFCDGMDYDVYASTGGIIVLNGPILVNGSIGGAGTILGWWRDTAGTLYSNGANLDLNGVADALVFDADGDTTMSSPTDDQIDIEVGGTDRARWLTVGLRFTTGHDCYPEDDRRGVANRFIWPVDGLTDHFRSGVIPTGYAWLAAGTLDGVAAAAPGAVTYNQLGDYLYITPPAASRSFLYKSGTYTVSSGARFYTRANGRFTSQGGIRIDKNGDNDFYEAYIRAYSTYIEFEMSYKVGGGATTTLTTALVYPISPFYVIQLYIYDTGAVQRAIFYLMNEVGDVTAMQASAGEAYWGNTTVRAGIIVRTVVGHLFDAFYNALF